MTVMAVWSETKRIGE